MRFQVIVILTIILLSFEFVLCFLFATTKTYSHPRGLDVDDHATPTKERRRFERTFNTKRFMVMTMNIPHLPTTTRTTTTYTSTATITVVVNQNKNQLATIIIQDNSFVGLGGIRYSDLLSSDDNDYRIESAISFLNVDSTTNLVGVEDIEGGKEHLPLVGEMTECNKV